MKQNILNSKEEYEKYKNSFINKWKPIFTNSSNKQKIYQLRKAEIFSDFEPLGHYIISSVFSERIQNFADIKELKI